MAQTPQWIELEDSAESDRKVYYSIVEDRAQWEPYPDGEVEVFNEEIHGQWRVLSSVVRNISLDAPLFLLL
jgi:hypothetical protein